MVRELANHPDVLHLQRTTAFGHYDDGFVLALERRTDHLGGEAPTTLSRQRIWRIRARHVVVATGAHERPIVFTDNDRPGIMLAASARTYLHRYGVKVGGQAVVFTTNDSAYAAAIDLHDAGVGISAVVDARPEAPQAWKAECDKRGIPVRTDSVISGTRGEQRIDHVLVSRRSDRDQTVLMPCDVLLVSGGWNPAVHLYSQARGTLRYDESLGAFLPAEPLPGISVAGSANGVFDLAGCMRAGRSAAAAALADLGFASPTVRNGHNGGSDASTAPMVLWRVADVEHEDSQFVDLQRDATVADLARAVRAGMRSMEHIKRYTTIGTAHDQGKTSGVISSGITAELLGTPIENLGTTTFRPPYTPVAFAALAGRDRGALFDPERVTALHDWHVRQDAVFEDVGQWKRPRYYPRGGGIAQESMETAVLRECAAVRGSVGILDGSTLGKIDVQGPDSGALLDMMYTNMMSTLKVGMVRYGVMCGVDGMVIDDGTVMRLADDRFQIFTTTGGAAKILDWMEEWLQTEWPHLLVRLTSVTEQWATFPVVGPKSRDVVGAVFADLDVSNDAFPFMAWRDTTLDGVPVRVARVSFSGELAFEVNVDGWHAQAVWDRLIAAGREVPHHAVRHRDDARAARRKGLSRSSARTPTAPSLRKTSAWTGRCRRRSRTSSASARSPARRTSTRCASSSSGLLPLDAETVLPEGAQIIEYVDGGVIPPPPVPMLGHITSSYRSAELGRPFGLALVKGGRSRIGDTLHVPVDGSLVAVEVTGSVLVDPEGARRDG